jgi:hypothetical protein
MERVYRKFAIVLTVASIAAAGAALAQTTDETENGSDGDSDHMQAAVIVATQLRAQGYQCDDPHKAEPDSSDTTPGEQAWIVTCDNATYRVKLVPDQAAKVEQID